jgi:hypothetical protein
MSCKHCLNRREFLAKTAGGGSVTPLVSLTTRFDATAGALTVA